MRIETGQGTISLKTLLSVWTISAIISLPGLAVSPILGSMTKIFPHATDMEIQMLSSIPSLMIIPFIILSGYLSAGYDKVKILVIGLLIYILSGAACIFARSMTMLIVLSTVLGIGAGMVIPLSTGFIARLFVGKYRTAQLGISSSISNLCLVFATFLTGWLADVNWHLPFVVYLFPIVTLVMSRFLDEKKNPLMTIHDPTRPQKSAAKIGLGKIDPTEAAVTPAIVEVDKAGRKRVSKPASAPSHEAKPILIPKGKNYNIRGLAGIMLLYFIAGYAALTVIFNLPFVILHHKLDSSVTGTLTSIFFLAIMTPGFFMNRIRTVLGDFSVMVSMILVGAGLAVISLTSHIALIGVGVVLTGLGYGFIQPFVYDKATQTSVPGKSIIALAYVMAMNYLTIVIAPFIIDGLDKLIGVSASASAPFMVSAAIALAVALWAAVRRKHFVFSL